MLLHIKSIDASETIFSKFIVCVGQVGWVFTNDLGDRGFISGRVIPKTQKMVLDATLLNTQHQHYKLRIKDKVEQSRERSSALTLYLGVVALENGTFGSPSTTISNLYIYIKYVSSEDIHAHTHTHTHTHTYTHTYPHTNTHTHTHTHIYIYIYSWLHL